MLPDIRHVLYIFAGISYAGMIYAGIVYAGIVYAGIGEGTKSDETTESAFVVDDGKLIESSLLHFRNRLIAG